MTTTAIDDLWRALKFEPTGAQAPILDANDRFMLVAGGGQAGKSVLLAHLMLKRMLEKEGKGLYWLVAADYDRTRSEFKYLSEDFSRLGLVKRISKRIDPGFIELVDGTRIETKSARDPRTLAMYSPDGIGACEASQLDLETYWKFEERVAASRGWVAMAGTFEGSLGWYPAMATAWQGGTPEGQRSFRLPTSSNTYKFPGGQDDPEILRIKSMASDDWFAERMEGIPRPPAGLVFPEFQVDLHTGIIDHIPGEPVYLAIDPGYAGAHAVECIQIIEGQVRVFDEIYERGLVTEDIIYVLTHDKPWWADAQKSGISGAIDVAGYSHQAMAAPAEVWMNQIGLYLSAEKVRINDGTERLKSFLKYDPLLRRPKTVIDSKCKGLLSELGGCPSPFDGQSRVYKWKTDRDGNIVGDTPDDKNNHAIKALIYWLISHFGYSYIAEKEKILVKYF